MSHHVIEFNWCKLCYFSGCIKKDKIFWSKREQFPVYAQKCDAKIIQHGATVIHAEEI